MTEAIEPAPFSRVLALRALGAPRPFAMAATTVEAAAVARLFAIEAVSGLQLAGTVEPVDGRYRLRGAVEAQVTQRCVVTAEPVTADVVAPFDRFLVVGDPSAEAEVIEVDPDADDIDYLDGPAVDVGAVAVEELALALEPYPRAPGADEALAALGSDERADHPFAALARRRAGS